MNGLLRDDGFDNETERIPFQIPGRQLTIFTAGGDEQRRQEVTIRLVFEEMIALEENGTDRNGIVARELAMTRQVLSLGAKIDRDIRNLITHYAWE